MERSWSQQLHSPSKSRPNVFHWLSPKAGVGGLFCLELRASNLVLCRDAKRPDRQSLKRRCKLELVVGMEAPRMI